MSTTLNFKNWSNNGFFESATLKELRGRKDSSLPSSQFSIYYQINICYTTKSTPPSMQLFTQYVPSEIKLSSPCSHFLSHDHLPQSFQKLSSLVSHINIPFPQTRLRWKSIKNLKPIHIRSQSDLVSCAFDAIRSIASQHLAVHESEQDLKLMLPICLVLDRMVVLAQDDFESLRQLALVNKNRVEGGGLLVRGPASDLVVEHRMRDDFSLPGLQEFFFSNKGIALTKERIDELNETVLKERLLKKVLTLDQESQELCSICHEELRDDGEAKVATPCSHLFHQDCIMKWIKTRNACPMCRFKF